MESAGTLKFSQTPPTDGYGRSFSVDYVLAGNRTTLSSRRCRLLRSHLPEMPEHPPDFFLVQSKRLEGASLRFEALTSTTSVENT